MTRPPNFAGSADAPTTATVRGLSAERSVTVDIGESVEPGASGRRVHALLIIGVRMPEGE